MWTNPNIYIYIFPHTDKKVTKERDRKSINLKLAHQGDGGYLEAFVLIVLAWIIFLGYPCKVIESVIGQRLLHITNHMGHGFSI
jgi:hypothetical protein